MSAADNVTGTDCFLPTHVRPTHYKLVIETNLESNPPTFSGDMIVYLHVDSECDTITFNAHPSLKINYLTVSAKGVAGYAVPVDTLTTDAAKERVSVNLGKFGSLKPATEDLKVFIAWEAELQPNLTGYYISTGDPDENGKKQM